jgi:hypothetical protein
MQANRYKINIITGLVLLTLGLYSLAKADQTPSRISIEPIGTYSSAIFNQSGAEIVAHDARTQRLFTVNALSGKVDVLDIRTPSLPTLLFSMDVSTWGGAANSVAAHNGLIAVAVENTVRTNNGQAVFFNADGEFIAAVEVGALPDMLTFTPNGRHVLVANEGEPSPDYQIDPEGSVSIIDLPANIYTLSQAHVRTARFTQFNDAELNASIRIFGPNATVAQDLEPEYITVDHTSRTAWVALQENNAIAVLDIKSGEFTALHGLGFKDHLLPGQGLDPSDQDGKIAIRNWPVMGMYQPDAIASYSYQGSTYLVTANEGDARDYSPFYNEESRFRALSGSKPVCAYSPRLQAFFANNPMGITTPAQLRDNINGMGRLTVTNASGLRADGSCYEDVYVFGARSFSIWRDDLTQVYDSGEDFERITAQAYPANFNSNHAVNDFDTRSDNKGPEPEGVAVAKLWGNTYAFIVLERIGGIMVYDISNPYAPVFVQYLNNRDFNADPDTLAAGDLGAEGIMVIEAGRSPIPGVPLLVVANEVSGTTTLFRINRDRQVSQQ